MTPSARPSMAVRRCCLLTRNASAGTPTTARTFGRLLPFCFRPTSDIRWRSSSQHRLLVRSEPSRITPRSSGRRRSSIGAVVERVTPDEERLLHDLARHHVDRPAHVAVDHVALAVRCRDRAARGAEVDAHTQRFVVFHGSSLFSADAGETVRSRTGCPAEGPRRPVSIVGGRQKLRFVLVGQARDLHQDRRHLGADEHGERRHLHAPVREPGVDRAERAIQLGIDRSRERPRLLPARVG